MTSHGPMRVRLGARATWRSQVSSTRVALKQGTRTTSGVVRTMKLVLDSVDPGAGPLAPLLLKGTISSAAPKAGPTPALHRQPVRSDISFTHAMTTLLVIPFALAVLAVPALFAMPVVFILPLAALLVTLSSVAG
jgi:hypothetical protein